MKILILGSSGQVGSELDVQLNSVLSNVISGLETKNLKSSDINYKDSKVLGTILEDFAPDWIINAAAYTNVDQAELDKEAAFEINFSLVCELVKYCSQNNVLLFHISTDYVFDGEGNTPLKEDDTKNPLGIYGQSKLAGEEHIINNLTGYLILRTSWVFGLNGNNFVKTILKISQHKDILEVVSDQYGAPTSARSIARTIATMILHMREASLDDSRWGVYNFSGYPYVSWAGFAEKIVTQASKKLLTHPNTSIKYIYTNDYPSVAKRPKNSMLECSKIKHIFNIDPDNWNHSLGIMLDEINEDT